jgi:hypothetical protein
MNEIVFGNLNFKLIDSYKIMKARIDYNEKICLFGDFSANASVYKFWGLFGGVGIDFEIDDQSASALSKIDDILTQEYGTPDYIAKGALKVWKEKDCYIVHGMDEKHYQVNVHIIKVCFKKPYCFMLDYVKYDNYFAVLSKISGEWGLEWSNNLVVLRRQIAVWMDTKNYSYYICFNRNKFAFYSSEKRKEAEGTRLIPSWSTKGKYKTVQDLHNQLDSFFNYLEEYDLSLKKD